MSELQKSGGKVVSSTPVNGVDGVKRIAYTTNKGKTLVKTVYDPQVISVDDYMARGASAVKNMPGDLSSYSAGPCTFPDSQGVDWAIFVRDGQVITEYPQP